MVSALCYGSLMEIIMTCLHSLGIISYYIIPPWKCLLFYDSYIHQLLNDHN